MAESPRFAQIEPVGQCNLRCTMCAIQYRQDGPPYGPPALMPFDEYVRLVDGLQAVEELHLQGLGEPLMHPRFFDMVRYAADRGIAVSVNTNLTLLPKRAATALATCGLTHLYVSIDGATAATYERIRVRAQFDRVLRNLQRVVAAIGERPQPLVTITTVLMRQNLEELAGIVALAARLGVPRVNVQNLSHDFGESTLPSQYEAMRRFHAEQTLTAFDAHRVSEAFSAARAAAEAAGVHLRLPRIAPRPERARARGSERCDFPWRGTYVSYDSQLMPCCMVSTPDRASFGTVREGEFDSVWNGSSAAAFRAALASDDPPELCRSCAVYHGTF